jgi:hypothetical protein
MKLKSEVFDHEGLVLIQKMEDVEFVRENE